SLWGWQWICRYANGWHGFFGGIPVRKSADRGWYGWFRKESGAGCWRFVSEYDGSSDRSCRFSGIGAWRFWWQFVWWACRNTGYDTAVTVSSGAETFGTGRSDGWK